MQRLQNRGPQRLHVPRVGAAWISRSTSATWRLTQSRFNPCRLEFLEWRRGRCKACAQATKGGGSGQQQSRMSHSCPRQPVSSSSELAENFLRWHDVDTGDSSEPCIPQSPNPEKIESDPIYLLHVASSRSRLALAAQHLPRFPVRGQALRLGALGGTKLGSLRYYYVTNSFRVFVSLRGRQI